MHQNECEDYLEGIINHSFEIITQDSLKKFSEIFEKNPSDIEEDLSELEMLGYIKIGEDRKITLTDEGRRTGECIIKKHRVLESFLTEMLGMEPDAASKEACTLEHGASNDTIKRLQSYLGGPGRCRRERNIHGIFTHNNKCMGNPLTSFSEDEKLMILCTKGGPGRTNRLHDLGVIPGEIIEINRRLSNGAMVVKIKSCEVALSPEIASSVFAEKIQ
ncbi:MAG: metal-dependent transcriptional regulator [Methanomicrobiaceae archaeon]|nr:metal-dependent transcriptional regulator [Methanomicrobiaceae archaeon]